jgi:predicted nuclease with TOPRIM domain
MTSNNDIGERVSRLEGGYEHLATKADIADVRTELANVKTELKADISETNVKIDRLTVEMARLETRMFLHMGGLVIVASAAIVGLQKLLE